MALMVGWGPQCARLRTCPSTCTRVHSAAPSLPHSSAAPACNLSSLLNCRSYLRPVSPTCSHIVRAPSVAHLPPHTPAVIYWICCVTFSLWLWYKRIYNACKNKTTAGFIVFFLFFGINILWCIWCCIGELSGDAQLALC